jgi:hypothetical protein
MSVESMVAGAASAASAWLWAKWAGPVVEKVLQAATDEAKKALRERWQRVRWDEAAQRYRQRMRQLYDTVRILGSPRPAPLEDLFTDLWILDRPTALRRYDIEQLCEDPARLQAPKRISGLRLVTRPEGQRLYILGKPGAGKTTFLKYLALQAVQGKLDALPILVVLREWADSGLDLMPFIARQFEICGFPDALPFIEHVLEQGRALVLFDGLDEVEREGGQRERAIAALRDFSKQYLESQCLITCRVAATEYTFQQYTYVELSDFTNDQIRVYAYKWFADEPVKRDRFIQELAREEHRGLRDLGRTPLLLSMLCLAFDPERGFPRRLSEIYEDALGALLKKWDSSRGVRRDEVYRGLSVGQKQRLLAQIAEETFGRGVYLIPERQLEQQIEDGICRLVPGVTKDEIDGVLVLRAIEAQHGVLVECAKGIHSFAHRTFHEYYVARYLIDNEGQGTVEGLIDGHLTDDRWHEVFVLTASMLDDAHQFFERFADTLDALARREPEVVTLLHSVNTKVASRKSEANELARARSLVLYYNLVCYLRRARDLGLDLDRDLDPDLAYDVAYDLGIARAFAPDLDTTLDVPGNLDFALGLALSLAVDIALVFDQAAMHLLVDYLYACRLYVECLDVAYVSDRAALRDRLLRAPKNQDTTAN